MRLGIRENLRQFLHQLLQVLLVGLTIGMMRTVVPALAETEFGVPGGSFVLITTFVIAFGVVKAALNFTAGWLSERIGRKPVLMLGWIAALPIPPIIFFANDWSWVVAATVLLGVNQGLAWSMTQTSKLDLARADERGMAIGANEFGGYIGVATAGLVTAYMAAVMSPRLALLLFGLAVVIAGLLMTLFFVRDTLPWAKSEAENRSRLSQEANDTTIGGWKVFRLVSWRNRHLAAVCQAGLVEKFVDALVWIFYPLFLIRQQLDLPAIGWVAGVYGVVWGVAQLFTGRLSDLVGRRWPNVVGMWICAAGVGMTIIGEGILWWSISAAVTGFGMALLYPNLSAAVADAAAPNWRAAAIGVYRFWRDLGYAVGAFCLGLASHITGTVDAAFVLVAAAMFLSGLVLLLHSKETVPVPRL